MNRKRTNVALYIIFAIFIIFLIAGLAGLTSYIASDKPYLTIGLIIVLSVSVLVVLLFIMAAGFAALGFHNPQQAMGLPDGSIRALIALLLILVWIILSIFLFNAAQSPGSTNPQVIQLSQELFTTLGTLVVAISAFYFGSTNVEAAIRSALSRSTSATQPSIQSINPNSGIQGEKLNLTIIGKNLGSPKAVRLALGQEPPISATDISYTQTEVSTILCTISFEKNQNPGQYDVIVVNYDDIEYKLEKAFEVRTASQP